LGTGDLTSLFLLNVFWVTNVTPLAAGGTASFTYWLIGGMLFFIPCSLVLAQLAALFPSAGGIASLPAPTANTMAELRHRRRSIVA
ncbi:MAG: amino acid permease, partial [Ktedonobacteraceae bacterium]